MEKTLIFLTIALVLVFAAIHSLCTVSPARPNVLQSNFTQKN